MRWSNSDLLAYEQRQAALLKQVMPPTDAVALESKLHDEIIAHCRLNRWVCVHSRMDKRTTQMPGVADFIITMPVGEKDSRTIYVEAKAKGQKLRLEQMAFKTLVEFNQGEYHVVYSMADFLSKI